MATYTNSTALAAALDIVRANSDDTELVEKLARMAEVAARPSKKATGPTKAQIMNLNLARKAAAYVWESAEAGIECVNSKIISTSAGIPEIVSTQKAASVLAVAAANGWVVKKDIKGKPYWAAGEVDPR